MSHTYNITLTQTQKRSLEYATKDPFDWIENAALARSDVAKNEIIDILVKHCNANNIQLSVGDSDQVAQAYDLGIIKTAAQRDSDAQSEL